MSSTDFLITSVCHQDICMYLFLQDNVISSILTWVGHCSPAGPGFASALSMITTPGLAGVSVPFCTSCIAAWEAVLSATCLAPGHSLLPLSKLVMQHSTSCHSFAVTPVTPPWSCQEAGPRALLPFLFPRHVLPSRHTHNQNLSAPAAALPLVSPQFGLQQPPRTRVCVVMIPPRRVS